MRAFSMDAWTVGAVRRPPRAPSSGPNGRQGAEGAQRGASPRGRMVCAVRRARGWSARCGERVGRRSRFSCSKTASPRTSFYSPEAGRSAWRGVRVGGSLDLPSAQRPPRALPSAQQRPPRPPRVLPSAQQRPPRGRTVGATRRARGTAVSVFLLRDGVPAHLLPFLRAERSARRGGRSARRFAAGPDGLRGACSAWRGGLDFPAARRAVSFFLLRDGVPAHLLPRGGVLRGTRWRTRQEEHAAQRARCSCRALPRALRRRRRPPVCARRGANLLVTESQSPLLSWVSSCVVAHRAALATSGAPSLAQERVRCRRRCPGGTKRSKLCLPPSASSAETDDEIAQIVLENAESPRRGGGA